MVDVKEPIVPASLFVATAAVGLKPADMSAGNEIKPPPPTIESIKAAKKPKTNNNTIISTESSMMGSSFASFVPKYSSSVPYM